MNRDRDLIDLERSSRSVFVGNIPYEATEESLRDIFSEVGPVVSFRLVFDRESGKPKGYGFAEYQDTETAMSAMRNLNNRELHGRSLRVDHATSEKNRIMEDLGQMGPIGPPRESPYGEPVPSRDAPEAISKAVASLPPEQMFELMKQMKQCIQNNPVEARNMLLQNPQLAYALLQAQVVMRIVDPEIAMKMLHRQNPVPNLIPAGEPLDRPVDGRSNGDPPGRSPYGNREPPRRMIDEPMDIPRRRDGSPPPRMLPRRGHPDDRMPMDIPMDRGRGEPMGIGPRDHPIDRRGPPMGPRGDRGRRSPEPFGRGPFGREFPDRGMDAIPGMGGLPMDRGPPIDRGPPMDRRPPDRGPIDRDGPPFHDRGGRLLDQRGGSLERNNVPGPSRDRGSSLERGGGDPRRGLGPQPGPTSGAAPPPAASGPAPAGAPDPNNPDQEKAALIMQVLQLTPEQIAMLPEEQRKSIMILKEQITGGRQ